MQALMVLTRGLALYSSVDGSCIATVAPNEDSHLHFANGTARSKSPILWHWKSLDVLQIDNVRSIFDSSKPSYSTLFLAPNHSGNSRCRVHYYNRSIDRILPRGWWRAHSSHCLRPYFSTRKRRKYPLHYTRRRLVYQWSTRGCHLSRIASWCV